MPRLYNYTIYKEDGTIEKIGPRKKMELGELQAAVGGHIELLSKFFKCKDKTLKGRFTAFCNEDGKFNGSERNPHFMDVYFDGSMTINGLPWHDWVTGDVIVEQFAGKDAVAV